MAYQAPLGVLGAHGLRNSRPEWSYGRAGLTSTLASIVEVFHEGATVRASRNSSIVSHIPSIASTLDTSNVSRNEIGNHSGHSGILIYINLSLSLSLSFSLYIYIYIVRRWVQVHCLCDQYRGLLFVFFSRGPALGLGGNRIKPGFSVRWHMYF